MNWLQAARRVRGAGFPLYAGAPLCAGMALALAGCAQTSALNPLKVGGVNPDSTISAEVNAVSRAPGPYPRFSDIPALSTDVRPVPAWRTAVVTEWGEKRQTEREAAAIPFTLANSEAWAEKTRAHMPLSETSQPVPNVATQSEAFAAAERARATPPPPPQ